MFKANDAERLKLKQIFNKAGDICICLKILVDAQQVHAQIVEDMVVVVTDNLFLERQVVINHAGHR